MLRSERGFTLIEVVVALVLVSILLAVLMQGALAAQQRANLLEQKKLATLIADALLSNASTASYQPGVSTGEAGAFTWRLAETEVIRDPRGFLVLAGLQVTVTDRDGHSLFSAATRKLKAQPE